MRCPTSSRNNAHDVARARAQSVFRAMMLAFAVGFIALAVVAFLVTKEVGVVVLLVVTYLGIAICGRLGQRWLLRDIDDG